MAIYDVTDPQTGQSMTLQGDSPPTEQELNQIFSQTRGTSQSADTRGATGNVSDVLRAVGFGAVPDVGAAIQNAGQSTGNAINGLLGRGQTPVHNDFQSPQLQQNLSTPGGVAKNIVEDAAGLGSYMIPETKIAQGAGVLPKIINAGTRGAISGESYGISQDQGTNPLYPITGAILGPIFSALTSGKLTQKGVNTAMEKVKNESMNQGVTKSWHDITTEVNQLLSQGPNQFRPDLVQEVQQVLSRRTPAATTGVAQLGPSEAAPEGLLTNILRKPELSANDLHDLRQALDKSIPQNAWNNPNVRQIGVQANQLVRGVISNALHEIAPETQGLDAINHLYYKAPFSKIGLPKIGSIKSPVPAGVPTAITNAILGALGVTEGGKLLKRFGL